MITIYTNKKYVDSNKEIIECIDLYFNAVSFSIELSEVDRKFMKELDKAEYKGNGMMETPFGLAFIDKLSSGCKTLILLNHFGDSKVINITECGRNALDHVYSMNNVCVLQTILEKPYKYDREKVVTLVDKRGKKQMTLREALNKEWKR